jgi:hypothetical protein
MLPATESSDFMNPNWTDLKKGNDLGKRLLSCALETSTNMKHASRESLTVLNLCVEIKMLCSIPFNRKKKLCLSASVVKD